MTDVQPAARIPDDLIPPAVIWIDYGDGSGELWHLQADGTWTDDADDVTIFRDGTELGWYIGSDRWLLLLPPKPKVLTEQKRTDTVDVLVQYDAGDMDEQAALDAIERIWT